MNNYLDYPLFVTTIEDKLLIHNPGDEVHEIIYPVEYVREVEDKLRGANKGWKSIVPKKKGQPIKTVSYNESIKDNGREFSRYLSYILTNHKEYLKSYPCKKEPKIMFFDIEVLTDGTTFPDPAQAKHPVVCFGYKFNTDNENTIIIMDDNKSDKNLIINALNLISQADIIVGYNSLFFDIPYILKRAEKHRIDPDLMTKPGFRNIRRKFDKILSPGLGVVHYDIYHTSVNYDGLDRDVTLKSLKNRKMKTVSEFYGFKGIEMSFDELNNISALWDTNKERLIDYQHSDVDVTAFLHDIYYEKERSLAKVSELPLNLVISRSNGTLVNIMIDRELRKEKWLNNLSNEDKYKILNNRYEGAVSTVFHTGYFEESYKVDFSQQYPSTMRMFNISPETVELINIEEVSRTDFDIMNYKWKRTDDSLIITIPDIPGKDSMIGRYVTLEIDIRVRGIVPKLADYFVAERKKYKSELKKYDKKSDDYKYYDSMQNSYKVLSNSLYGILGNTKSNVGDMLCALAVTGICRFVTRKVISWIESEEKDSVIEVDTDGLIVKRPQNVEDLNSKIALMFEELAGIPRENNELKLENEEMGKLYMYKTKNYIVEHSDGSITKHGNVFKSTRIPKIVDRAINLLVDTRVRRIIEFDTAREKAMDFDNARLDDFIISQKVYKYEPYFLYTKNVELKSLYRQFYKINSRSPIRGDNLDYFWVKTPRGEGVILKEYMYRKHKDNSKLKTYLDTSRYVKEINKRIDIFSEGTLDVPTVDNILSLLGD